MAFHPYITFGGNCREAFSHYQEVFGGELVLLPWSEAPSPDEIPPERRDQLMHASLQIGDDLLMASDHMGEGEFQGVQGTNVCCTVPDADEAKRVFTALADGGTVVMPLEPTFFSPMFGMCVDRFGTPWIIDTDAPDGFTPDA